MNDLIDTLIPLTPATMTDGYKLGHGPMYPALLQRIYSNLTARSSRIAGQRYVIKFGEQFTLQRYFGDLWQHGFFDRSIDDVVAAYRRRMDSYLGPGAVGVDHIAALHGIGYLPLEIRSFPEGSAVPIGVPMLTIENTHDDFGWLTNYEETLLSDCMWLPITSATTASRFRRLMDQAAHFTGSPPEFVDWQGHDFSFRGMHLPEAGALSGAAHLLFFTGTDTVPALDLIEHYYGPLPADYLVGGSVAATEHSVMCAGGQADEADTFNRLLDLHPTGILSIVSDTWDLWKVCTEIMDLLHDRIMERDGKVVIRPDSGDPVDILCGDPTADFDSPAHRGVIQLLWDRFGGTKTHTGHRVLDPHIGSIYGDGITEDRATRIFGRLSTAGFASANVVLGLGSFTYAYVTRDTYGMAVKATWAQVDGVGRDLFKAPVTDADRSKFSAKGRLAVVADENGQPTLIQQATALQEDRSLLQPVWRNGEFDRYESFDVIRARARQQVVLAEGWAA